MATRVADESGRPNCEVSRSRSLSLGGECEFGVGVLRLIGYECESGKASSIGDGGVDVRDGVALGEDMVG